MILSFPETACACAVQIVYLYYRNSYIMRKFLSVFLFCFFVMPHNYAQTWVCVGSQGFSGAGVSGTHIAINKSTGVPYVVYEDGSNGDRVTVMKYDPSSAGWVVVGSPGFSAGIARFTSLAIDPSGAPYVVYRDDNTLNSAITVMKFNGSSWVTVGSAGFSAGEANFSTIAIDSGGTPYVAYEDFANGGKATVMKHNGSAWIDVGVAGFSADTSLYTSIAINRNGN